MDIESFSDRDDDSIILETYKRKISKETNFHNIRIHRNTKQVVIILLNASLGSIFWGYCMLYYNPSMAQINKILGISQEKDRYQSNIEAFITSSLLFGGFLGSILGVYMLQIYTRRSTMMITDIIGVLGSLISAAYPSIFSIIGGRVLQGIACGMNSVVVPLYIKEMTPLQLMGATSIINPGNLFIGSFTAYLIGLGYPSKQTHELWYWRLVFAFPLVFCIIRFVMFCFVYKFDTPHSLLMFGQKKKALIAKKRKQRSGFQDILSKELYQKTLIGILIMYLSQMIGQNAMTFYSTKMINYADNYDILDGRIYKGIAHIIACSCVVFTGYLVQKFGKKKLVAICSLSLACINVLLSIAWFLAYHYSDNNLTDFSDVSPTIWNSIISLLILFRANIALGTVAPMFGYVADVSGDKAVMISKCCYWFTTLLIAIFFVEIKLYLSFMIFAVHSVITFLFFKFKIKETKDLSRRELEQLYVDHRVSYKKIKKVTDADIQQYKQNLLESLIEKDKSRDMDTKDTNISNIDKQEISQISLAQENNQNNS